MRYILFALTTLVVFNVSYASSGAVDISKTDIVERLINFAIFVALMWYLLADKAKKILSDRSNSISERLSQTQSKVREAREKKERALKRLKEAREQAIEISNIAKKEANMSVLQIEEKTKEQISNLIKANDEAIEFQEKLLQKQLIAEILQEIFSSKALELDSYDYVSILEKKVV